MKKLTALILTALLLVYSPAFAAKPGTQPESTQPLRVLWATSADPACGYFYSIESNTGVGIIGLSTGGYVLSKGTANNRLSPTFSTQAEAVDWLIHLFIRINGLNATLADVPLDSNGQRDCIAWNNQLIGY